MRMRFCSIFLSEYLKCRYIHVSIRSPRMIHLNLPAFIYLARGLVTTLFFENLGSFSVSNISKKFQAILAWPEIKAHKRLKTKFSCISRIIRNVLSISNLIHLIVIQIKNTNFANAKCMQRKTFYFLLIVVWYKNPLIMQYNVVL